MRLIVIGQRTENEWEEHAKMAGWLYVCHKQLMRAAIFLSTNLAISPHLEPVALTSFQLIHSRQFLVSFHRSFL